MTPAAPVAGFFGKIPSRGDFVRAGLPTDLVRGLDAWCQAVLPGSRARLGDPAWAEAWMEAPPWRFHLPPAVLTPNPVLGVWLASTDRAGRLFPLVLAATAPDPDALSGLDAFWDAAEALGLAAVAEDFPPERLAAALSEAMTQAVARSQTALPPPVRPTWWTTGSRLVSPARRTFPAMPDADAFAAMLRDADAPGNGSAA